MTEPVTPEPRGLGKYLGYVPRALSSHLHVLWLLALGVYLIVLPLTGVHVSNFAELVGGNYTNVTSDIGACIAAGGTLHLIKHQRDRHTGLVAEIRRLHERLSAQGVPDSADRQAQPDNGGAFGQHKNQ